jgi:hypothetical protein
VRRDTGEKYEEFLSRLAKESGINTPTSLERSFFNDDGGAYNMVSGHRKKPGGVVHFD